MHPCSDKARRILGSISKGVANQVDGNNSSRRLSTLQTISTALCTILGSPVRQRVRRDWSHWDDQGARVSDVQGESAAVTAVFHHLKRDYREGGARVPQKYTAKQQEGKLTSSNMGNFDCRSGSDSSPWWWLSTSTGCPGTLWNCHLWVFSSLNRQGSEQADLTSKLWSLSSFVPVFPRHFGLDNLQRPLPTPDVSTIL